ncbi:MAG: hypothetical protein GQ546_04045 [Gammaproteobacteria bacterium]|nr:hypothetical protein [Gammaproteobacteria bacterium]
MSIRNNLASCTLACIIATSTFTLSSAANASDAGAFIGGVFATKLLGNMRRSADAEQEQAAAAQQPIMVQSASSKPSAEQRIKQLDKLAAGGYITPAEYKKKKQAIINSM